MVSQISPLGWPGEPEIVAAHAVRVNVFHTIDFLLKYSAPIREQVRNGQLEIQGVEGVNSEMGDGCIN